MDADDEDDPARMLEEEGDQTALAMEGLQSGGESGGGGGAAGESGGSGGGDADGSEEAGGETTDTDTDTGGVDPVDTGVTDSAETDTADSADTDAADSGEADVTETDTVTNTETDTTGDVADTTAAASTDPVPVVDGSTGQVVALARYNPEAQVFEFDDPDATVVEETSSAEVEITVGGTEGVSFTEDPSPGAAPTGTPKGSIPPRVFSFRPVLDNWQETDCVPIVFNSPLGSYPRRVTVGIKVGAPLRLAGGKTISPDEAAEDSSFAAEGAALAIAKLLDMGAPAAQIQKVFYQFMQQVLDTSHKGYRVNDCTGSV
jgi:hypothetical protein